MDKSDGGGSEFKIITCNAEIDRSAAAAWTVVGSYGDAGRFLNVASKVIAGDGGLGSVRLIGDAILEVMVGKSRYSYAYAQTRGPMASFAYHGCVSLDETGPGSSTLTYTLIYDQAGMDDDRRAAEAARISARFGGAAEEMKRQAEAKA